MRRRIHCGHSCCDEAKEDIVGDVVALMDSRYRTAWRWHCVGMPAIQPDCWLRRRNSRDHRRCGALRRHGYGFWSSLQHLNFKAREDASHEILSISTLVGVCGDGDMATAEALMLWKSTEIGTNMVPGPQHRCTRGALSPVYISVYSDCCLRR